MTFISNLDEDLYRAIWDASLEAVPEPKYRQAEAWDLFQCLERALGMPGDVVEFGTYRGHSGWLMAEFLRLRSSDRALWLFDTFDRFPDEQGDDAHWSGTHLVDFAEVQALFAPFDNVHLVRGDFTETAHGLDMNRVCFAHIDCDSYRGVRYALNWAMDRRPCLVLCQDYGQPHCDGARRAADEFLAKTSEWYGVRGIYWFSFHSGSMVAWL